MGRMELAGALTVFSFLLYGCGTNTPEPSRTPTPLHPTLPVPELFTPTPTHLPLPTTATVYETPRPTRTPTLLFTPTTRPSYTPNDTATRVWNPPIWCERTPVLVGAVDTSAKKYVYIFGTSFSSFFMQYQENNSTMRAMFSNVIFKGSTHPGEDMDVLATHLKDMSRDVQIRPHAINKIVVQPDSWGLLKGRDPAIVLQESDAMTQQIQACIPEAHIVRAAPILNEEDPIELQLKYGENQQTHNNAFGWGSININNQLLLSNGKLNTALYKDTLHLTEDANRDIVAPALHAAIIAP